MRHGIPAVACSVAHDSHLPYAEPYLVEVIGELLEAGLKQGEAWNVNFPMMKYGTKGILRNRPAAHISLYREKYIETRLPDGSIVLTNQGIPTPNEQIPEGTDAWAVRNGYIAIGKVNGFVL